jgi:hypothetical protein
MEDFLSNVFNTIVRGGTPAIFGLMCGAIGFLVWDRTKLLKDLDETTERVYEAKDSEMRTIKEIINKYHEGSVDMIQALNEIKIVLNTIHNSRR